VAGNQEVYKDKAGELRFCLKAGVAWSSLSGPLVVFHAILVPYRIHLPSVTKIMEVRDGLARCHDAIVVTDPGRIQRLEGIDHPHRFRTDIQ
jgi:hypothetical protein